LHSDRADRRGGNSESRPLHKSSGFTKECTYRRVFSRHQWPPKTAACASLQIYLQCPRAKTEIHPRQNPPATNLHDRASTCRPDVCQTITG